MANVGKYFHTWSIWVWRIQPNLFGYQGMKLYVLLLKITLPETNKSRLKVLKMDAWRRCF